MAESQGQAAPGEPAKADVALLESLRARLMSLVWMLEQMKRELLSNPAAPPEWYAILRSVNTHALLLSSSHSLEEFSHVHTF